MLRKEAAYCELTGASGIVRGRPRWIGLGWVDIEASLIGQVFSMRDAGGNGGLGFEHRIASRLVTSSSSCRSAEGLGVVLHGQSERFLDASEVPALGDHGFGRFQ